MKFISIGEDAIEKSGLGILSYITNATMLASSSLRGMRESLDRTFYRLFELNLHGGVNETSVGRQDDENIFDISLAVAVHVYIRSLPSQMKGVYYSDITGTRQAKYTYLSCRTVNSMDWTQVKPDTENHSFIPQDDTAIGTNRRLDTVFVQFGAGIKTNRDSVAIQFDRDTLVAAVRQYNPRLIKEQNYPSYIHKLLYRPFDIRHVFYHEGTVASRSLPTMKHMIAGPNIGLIASSTWTTPERFSVNVSKLMAEMKTGTHDRGTTFFPIYRYLMFGSKIEQVHNFTKEFIDEWINTTNMKLLPLGRGDLKNTSGPEDILLWTYGLLHSPVYRQRYQAALSQGFPIMMTSSNKVLLKRVIEFGSELVDLHLMESPRLDRHLSSYFGPVNPEIEKISFSYQTVWLDKKKTRGFRAVPDLTWNFHIGGYPVCYKWLKDRKGHTLSKDEIEHYHRIIVAISETIRLMKEIDEVIEQYGGWPGAFS